MSEEPNREKDSHGVSNVEDLLGRWRPQRSGLATRQRTGRPAAFRSTTICMRVTYGASAPLSTWGFGGRSPQVTAPNASRTMHTRFIDVLLAWDSLRPGRYRAAFVVSELACTAAVENLWVPLRLPNCCALSVCSPGSCGRWSGYSAPIPIDPSIVSLLDLLAHGRTCARNDAVPHFSLIKFSRPTNRNVTVESRGELTVQWLCRS